MALQCSCLEPAKTCSEFFMCKAKQRQKQHYFDATNDNARQSVASATSNPQNNAKLSERFM